MAHLRACTVSERLIDKKKLASVTIYRHICSAKLIRHGGKMADFSMLNKIPLLSILLLSFAFNGAAQGKVDLELTVQTAANSVRGGETFAYSLTVRNIGSSKATKI